MDEINEVNKCRADIKAVATRVDEIRRRGFSYGLPGMPTEEAGREAEANVLLTYRHLEDASMRLGKVLQALDGGVSV